MFSVKGKCVQRTNLHYYPIINVFLGNKTITLSNGHNVRWVVSNYPISARNLGLSRADCPSSLKDDREMNFGLGPTERDRVNEKKKKEKMRFPSSSESKADFISYSASAEKTTSRHAGHHDGGAGSGSGGAAGNEGNKCAVSEMEKNHQNVCDAHPARDGDNGMSYLTKSNSLWRMRGCHIIYYVSFRQ